MMDIAILNLRLFITKIFRYYIETVIIRKVVLNIALFRNVGTQKCVPILFLSRVFCFLFKTYGLKRQLNKYRENRMTGVP